jgi:hypothetical protein
MRETSERPRNSGRPGAKAMKRIAIAAVLLSCLTGAPAFADEVQYDFDLIHRSPQITDAQMDAGVQAATQTCDPSDRHNYRSRQFLSCMRAKGYKLVRVEHQKSSPSDPYFSSNAKVAPGHFIDHDNGMDCQNTGFAEVCSPPNGTVHYFDPDQNLPCTRTGAMAVCSNI